MAKAENDHNVYILGAGFAAEAGLPVVKDFMNRMRDAHAWLEAQGDRKREQEAIEKVLEFRLKAAAAAYRVQMNVENIEELFSLASASVGETLTEEVILAIAATVDFARRAAPRSSQSTRVGVLDMQGWTKPKNWTRALGDELGGSGLGQSSHYWHNCPQHELHLAIMCGCFSLPPNGRRNTFITFNYDLLVEDALNSLGISFDYGIPMDSVSFEDMAGPLQPQHPVLSVLKLHGSVNWSLRQPSEFRQWPRSFPRMRSFGDYDRLSAAGEIPLLTPPTWRKVFSAPLSSVWDAAVVALKTATRVVILGYSVPETDHHFKYLLAAGLQENVSLRKVFFVNNGLEAKPEGDELKLRLSGLLREEHFKQGVVETINKTAHEFLGGADVWVAPGSYRTQIGRPINSESSDSITPPFVVQSAGVSGLLSR
jgi:hypothetical protein